MLLFAAEDGKTYTVYDVINTYAAGKLAELKNTAYTTIDSIDGIDKDAVKADVDAAMAEYVNMFNTATKNLGKVFTANRSKNMIQMLQVLFLLLRTTSRRTTIRLSQVLLLLRFSLQTQ